MSVGSSCNYRTREFALPSSDKTEDWSLKHNRLARHIGETRRADIAVEVGRVREEMHFYLLPSS